MGTDSVRGLLAVTRASLAMLLTLPLLVLGGMARATWRRLSCCRWGWRRMRCCAC